MTNLAEQLKSELRLLLVDELGAFGNNATAIDVRDPEKAPNNGRGLHCLISPRPTDVGKAQIWQVVLKQYDTSDRGDAMFNGAIAKLRENYICTCVVNPFNEDRVSQAVFRIEVARQFTGAAIVGGGNNG